MKVTNHHRGLIALLKIPDLGPRRGKLLLAKTGVQNASEVFGLSLKDLMQVEGVGKQVAGNIVKFDDWAGVDKILERTEKSGSRLLHVDDECYPRLLRHIYDPPLLLWYKGDQKILQYPGMAVIGTRTPSRYGLQQTSVWAKALAGKGLTINSGLAYGIDAAAHRTALEAGGRTAAVLGSGIDVLYPAKNYSLADKMIENGGVILTEFPPGTKPDAVNFPARNRIVSGMSHGVVVVESGIKGGSMITARCALDQNREVFVIPHQLGNPKGEGCNYLIRTGQGKLIQTVSDILEEISVETAGTSVPVITPPKAWKDLNLKKEFEEVCILLEKEAKHIDQISEEMEKPVFKLLPMMLELEMAGAVKQKAGKYFELC